MRDRISTETELRHAVIDRLIAASMENAPHREAALQRWRDLAAPNAQKSEAI